MKRALLAAAVSLAATAAVAASFSATIDLDQPGALDRVARDRPAHVAKIRRILEETPKRPLAGIGGWMRTEFDARDVDSGFRLKTSHPPKATLHFTLDDVRYQATVTMLNVKPETLYQAPGGMVQAR